MKRHKCVQGARAMMKTGVDTASQESGQPLPLPVLHSCFFLRSSLSLNKTLRCKTLRIKLGKGRKRWQVSEERSTSEERYLFSQKRLS